MCIIIVKPEGVQMPPLGIIERCALKNPDGFGVAVPGQVFRTLSFRRLEKFLSGISDDVPAVLHFRYATTGSVKVANCHPFRDDSLGVSFAHNGVLPIWTENDMTDSETLFRRTLAPAIAAYGFWSDGFEDAVLSNIGVSRFAFLSDDGQTRTFGQFFSHAGCLYSNRGFM